MPKITQIGPGRCRVIKAASVFGHRVLFTLYQKQIHGTKTDCDRQSTVVFFDSICARTSSVSGAISSAVSTTSSIRTSCVRIISVLCCRSGLSLCSSSSTVCPVVRWTYRLRLRRLLVLQLSIWIHRFHSGQLVYSR